MKEKKLYYAYVVEDQVVYFEEQLAERKDKIEVVFRHPTVSDKGDPIMSYVLEAEPGVINSKWEIK